MLTDPMRRLRRLIWCRGHESGQALLFVLIAVTLLASIPIAIATTTIDQLPQTTRNLNYEAAYEAAQAGLNDYIQHLDANEAYGLFNKSNPGSPANPAFTGWVQASTSPPEYYAYAPTNSNGLISLQVSGKAGTGSTAVVRTFTYAVQPDSSLDDVYWSNYETRDPILGALLPSPPADYQYCATHYNEPSSDSYGAGWSTDGSPLIPQYGPPINPTNACEVSFQTGDTLNGPIFSDDSFRICGSPTFDSSVQSGNIYSSSPWVASAGCGGATPAFNGGSPVKVSNQTPRDAEDDLTPARTYGCFITGGTSPSSLTPTNVTITLSVSGAYTKITWTGSGGTIVDNAAGNTNNCTSPVLTNNLTSALFFVNGNATVSGTMAGGLDIVTCATDHETSCDDPGGVKSNILIPGNLEYQAGNKTMVGGQPVSDSLDSLGLIAQNFVEVTATSTIEIDAAILALKDSFYVNNWFSGSDGTLNVFGSIAQNFRGPVGQSGGIGYVKNYNYDSSLQTLFPPFFLPPQGATWAPNSYEECAAGNAKSVLNTPSC